MATARTLDEYIDDAFETPDIPEDGDTTAIEATKQRFEVDSEEKANWALRKVAKIRAKKRANLDLADREITRIRRWLDDANKVLSREEDFFCGVLVAYHNRLYLQDPKHNKTIKLPLGQLKRRKQEPEMSFEDAALIAWLKEHAKGQFVRQAEVVEWGEFKKALRVDKAIAYYNDIEAPVTVAPRGARYSVVTEEGE